MSKHRHRWTPWRYALGNRTVRSCQTCPMTQERAGS